MQSFVDDLFNSLFSIDHIPPTTPYTNTRQFQFTNGNIPTPLSESYTIVRAESK